MIVELKPKSWLGFCTGRGRSGDEGRGDVLILPHVRSTSVLHGADWSAIDLSIESEDATSEVSLQKLEEDFDACDQGTGRGSHSQGHGLGVIIMGSRGFRASRRNNKSRLGSMHQVLLCASLCLFCCGGSLTQRCYWSRIRGCGIVFSSCQWLHVGKDNELHAFPEEEQEYHHADDEHRAKDNDVYEKELLDYEEEEEKAPDSVAAKVSGQVAALVMCHTRELAFQICHEHLYRKMQEKMLLQDFRLVDPVPVEYVPSRNQNKNSIQEQLNKRASYLSSRLIGTSTGQLVVVPCNVG
ncbi:hypothetical protein ZIOFF_022917 [Zingiber officinale]|uniref:Uncharacterized protein n=1 Tax=Zingiber officinale TaxID=94328 RepID=A0A8J5LKI6_ZINOF|nr:hypothetical protein ZIOFF_022917 [Zingiber officinale]